MQRVAARPENLSTDNTNAGAGSAGSSTNLVQHPVAEDDKSTHQERVVVSNTATRADVVVQANNPATSNAAFSNVASASTQNIQSTSAPAVVQNELTVEAVRDPAIIPREDPDVGVASLCSSSNAALAGTNQSNQITLNQSMSRAPAVQEGPTAEALRDPAIIPRDEATASSSTNLATGNESTHNLQGGTSAPSVQQEQITADELWDMLGEDKDKQRDEGPALPRPRDADTAPSNPVAENESTDENQNTRAPAVQEGPTAEALRNPPILRDAATASSFTNLVTGNESTQNSLQGNTSAPAVQQEQLTADALWDMLGQDVSRQKDEAGRQLRHAEAASSTNQSAGTASTENQSTRAPAVVQDGLSAGALRDPAILPRVAATSSSSSSAAASGNQSSQINQSTSSAPAVQEELTADVLRNPPIPGNAATASSSSSSNVAVVGNQSSDILHQSTTDPAVQQQLTADALWDMLGGQDVDYALQICHLGLEGCNL